MSQSEKIKPMQAEINSQSPPWGQEAVHSIWAASTASETYVNKKHREYGITECGIAILMGLVQNNGKLPQKRLSRVVNRTKQAVTSVLANLEKRNLIVREVGGQDRRKRTVKITEKGLDLAQKCLPLRDQFYKSFLSCLNQSEAEQMISALNRISAKLNSDIQKFSKSKSMNSQTKPETD
jgi:DNA-binding MarR family transcriptional regulator